MDDVRFVIAAYTAGAVVLAGYIWHLASRLRTARERAPSTAR
jgi:hypothetical protein